MYSEQEEMKMRKINMGGEENDTEEHAMWQIAGYMLSSFLKVVLITHNFCLSKVNKQIREFKKPFQNDTLC